MNEDKKQIGIASLFPTPVIVTKIGRDFTKDELQLFLKDIPMWKDKEGMTNHRSVNLTLFEDSPNLKDIKNFCESQLKIYLEEIEGVDTNLAGLRITQAWLNRTKPGESHHPHFHPNSYLSGVLYISCLPKDGINFENRSYGFYNSMEFPKKKATTWNVVNITQIVTEGDLVIFPSWVPHHVDVNKTKDKERISLSFNTFPIGEMGSSLATHLKL